MLSLQVSLIAAVLGIVEGLTEFIPVSSTGHLIIVGELLHFSDLVGEEQAGLFDVVIQLGAILAVGVYFRERLIKALLAPSPYTKAGKLRTYLFIAFLPAVFFGFLFHDIIKHYLFSPITVSIALIVGGIIIMLIERRPHKDNPSGIEEMKAKHAWIVGFAQVASLIPGVSRSGATIIGGVMGGMTRVAATEFSFLLSFPIMIAATGYDLLKYRHILNAEILLPISIGFVTAFISAWVVVGWLVKFVQRHSFFGFGVYRVVFGSAMLLLYAIDFLR